MNPSYITSYLPFSPSSAAMIGGGSLAIIGPVMFYAPSKYRWWILGGILLIIGLVFLIRIIYGWFVGRKAKASEQALEREQQEAEDRASSVEERQKVREIREKFKVALQQLRDAKIPLYDLPWMMLIGEPQGGKTLTLRGSGLSFPVGYDAISGLGGTKNCDWFFANEAVFLDTAGRWTFSQEGASDSREWQTFLGDLVKKRRHCPINGCVVVIPVDALWRSPEKRMEEASNIYNKLGELQRTLKVRFPVFIMITKCDKLLGFTEFFQDFGDLPAQQIFGYSRPVADTIEAPYDDDAFDDWFGHLMHRLSDRRTQILRHLVGMDDKTTLDRRGRAFELPENFRSIGPALQGYLANIFARDRYHEPLFFRGVYFSSGIQTGTVSSSAMREILTGLGSEPPAKDEAEALPDSRPFFLQDFYQRKVLKESGMVFRSGREIKQAKRRTLVTYVGGAVLAVALGVLLYVGQSKVAKIFSEPDMVVTKAREEWVAAEHKPLPPKAASKNVKALSNAHLTLADPGPWFRALFPLARTSKPSTDVLTVQNAIFGKSLLAPQVQRVAERLSEPPAEGQRSIDIDSRTAAFREIISWYATNGPWRQPQLAADEPATADPNDPNAADQVDEEVEQDDADKNRWRQQAERLLAPLTADDPNQDVLEAASVDPKWFKLFLTYDDEKLRDYYGDDQARRIPIIHPRFARSKQSRLEAIISEMKDACREAYLTPSEDSEFGRWLAVYRAIDALRDAMKSINGMSDTFAGVRTVGAYDSTIEEWDRDYQRLEAAYEQVNQASIALRGTPGQPRKLKIPNPKIIQQNWNDIFQDAVAMVDGAEDSSYHEGAAEKQRVIDWLEQADRELDQQANNLVKDLKEQITELEPYWTHTDGLDRSVESAYEAMAALNDWLHAERQPAIAGDTLPRDWPGRLSNELQRPPGLREPPGSPRDLGDLKPLLDNVAMMLNRHQRFLDVVAGSDALQETGELTGFYAEAEKESSTINYPGLRQIHEQRFLTMLARHLCDILKQLDQTDALDTGSTDHVVELQRALVAGWDAYVRMYLDTWLGAYEQSEQDGIPQLLGTSRWSELENLMSSNRREFDLWSEASNRHKSLSENLDIKLGEAMPMATEVCDQLKTIFDNTLAGGAYRNLLEFQQQQRAVSNFLSAFEGIQNELGNPRGANVQRFKDAYAKLPTAPSWGPKTLKDLRRVADHANNLSSANLYSDLAAIVAPYAGSFPFQAGGSGLPEQRFRQFSIDLLEFYRANKELIASQDRVQRFIGRCLNWITFVYGKEALQASGPADLRPKELVFMVLSGGTPTNLTQTWADVTIGLRRGIIGSDPGAGKPYTAKKVGLQGMGRKPLERLHYWQLGASSEFQVVIYRDSEDRRIDEASYPRSGGMTGDWLVPQLVFTMPAKVVGRALRDNEAAIGIPFPSKQGGEGRVTIILDFDAESTKFPRDLIGSPPTR
jgi:hypothetical protein